MMNARVHMLMPVLILILAIPFRLFGKFDQENSQLSNQDKPKPGHFQYPITCGASAAAGEAAAAGASPNVTEIDAGMLSTKTGGALSVTLTD